MKIIVLLLVSVGALFAQNPAAPDCIVSFNFTAAGSSAVFDNRYIGCVTWTIAYQSSGFSGLTLTFQSATGANTAGSFGTYTGSITGTVPGINPNTSTTGAITQFANGIIVTPWLRVNLSGLTGSGRVDGVLYGYKTGYSAGNGGGSGGGSGTVPWDMVKTSATVSTIGGVTCTTTPPLCVWVKGNVPVFTQSAGATVTLSGISNSGTVYWYITSAGVLTAGHNTSTTLTGSGIFIATGITGFPVGSKPLWVTTFTANVWDAIVYLTMDKRGIISGYEVAAGSGISMLPSPIDGTVTVSTDPTVVPRYFTGAGAPGISCTTGRDFYTDTMNLNLYFCDALNTWKLSGNAGTVTSVSFTGGLISVANPTGAAAMTVAGTSGGIPYFSGAATWESSAALTANLPVIGGGAGTAPSVGSRTGNTTQFATWTGATTSSRCVDTDASGNLKVSSADCGTDRQSFWLNSPSASDGSIATAVPVIAGTDVQPYGGSAFTGPNSIAAHFAQNIMAVNDWVFVSKQSSSTWSAAAGTVDVSLVAFAIDGAPSAGNWNLNFYIGCAASASAFTYGAATTVTSVPNSAGFSTYTATGLALPAACAASKPMQFWVQRVADTGGVTGVRVGAVMIETVIRGN